MQNDLIPQSLHADFNQFLNELTQLGQQTQTHCPYCDLIVMIRDLTK